MADEPAMTDERSRLLEIGVDQLFKFNLLKQCVACGTSNPGYQIDVVLHGNPGLAPSIVSVCQTCGYVSQYVIQASANTKMDELHG